VLRKGGIMGKGMTRIMLFGARHTPMIVLVFLCSIVLAQELGESQFRFVEGLNNICSMMMSILPIITIVLFVVAAVAYGAGHIFGAEMKSRATSWATSMIVGAIIALIITLLARPLLGLFMPSGTEIPADFCTPNYTP